jgi:hypothetical protein
MMIFKPGADHDSPRVAAVPAPPKITTMSSNHAGYARPSQTKPDDVALARPRTTDTTDRWIDV